MYTSWLFSKLLSTIIRIGLRWHLWYLFLPESELIFTKTSIHLLPPWPVVSLSELLVRHLKHNVSRLMERYSSHLTAFVFLCKGIRIVYRNLGSPLASYQFCIIISWQSWVNAFNALSPILFNISAGMLSTPSVLLFFISLMATNSSSLSNSGPVSSSPSSTVPWLNQPLGSVFSLVEVLYIFFPSPLHFFWVL